MVQSDKDCLPWLHSPRRRRYGSRVFLQTFRQEGGGRRLVGVAGGDPSRRAHDVGDLNFVEQAVIEETSPAILANGEVVGGGRGRTGRGAGNIQHTIHVDGQRPSAVVDGGIDLVPAVIGHRHAGHDAYAVASQILQRQGLV